MLSSKFAVVAGLATAAFAVAAGQTAEGASTAPCRPRAGQPILVSGGRQVVYASNGFAKPDVLCDRQTAKRQTLNEPPGTFVFPPPAIALSGSLSALAVYTFGMGLEDQVTDLSVDRLDDRSIPTTIYSARIVIGIQAGPKVAAVVLAPSGSVAWMACPATLSQADLYIDLRGGPRATCQRTGAHVYVFRHLASASSDKPERLADSKSIDPRSLSLTHGTVSWTQSGRRRQRNLP